MSRIGKKPIQIPQEVKVRIKDKIIEVKGPKGKLSMRHRGAVSVVSENDEVKVSPTRSDRFAKSVWGLTRTLIYNMIIGVTEGFTKKLEFFGVGYKVSVEKTSQDQDKISLSVGFSHPVEIIAPSGINFAVHKNIITVSGIDKELVGQVTAQIRSVRPPEPYKGKGIKYEGEVVRRKAGKAIVKGAQE